MNMIDQAIDTLRQRQQLLAVLVFTLVAIIVWIAISIISSQNTSAISKELRKMAEPLTPSLNTQVIQQIEQETHYSDDELRNFPIFRVLTDEERRAAVTATNSANPTPEPAFSPTPAPSPSPTTEVVPEEDPSTATNSSSIL